MWYIQEGKSCQANRASSCYGKDGFANNQRPRSAAAPMSCGAIRVGFELYVGVCRCLCDGGFVLVVPRCATEDFDTVAEGLRGGGGGGGGGLLLRSVSSLPDRGRCVRRKRSTNSSTESVSSSRATNSPHQSSSRVVSTSLASSFSFSSSDSSTTEAKDAIFTKPKRALISSAVKTSGISIRLKSELASQYIIISNTHAAGDKRTSLYIPRHRRFQ